MRWDTSLDKRKVRKARWKCWRARKKFESWIKNASSYFARSYDLSLSRVKRFFLALSLISNKLESSFHFQPLFVPLRYLYSSVFRMENSTYSLVQVGMKHSTDIDLSSARYDTILEPFLLKHRRLKVSDATCLLWIRAREEVLTWIGIPAVTLNPHVHLSEISFVRGTGHRFSQCLVASNKG